LGRERGERGTRDRQTDAVGREREKEMAKKRKKIEREEGERE